MPPAGDGARRVAAMRRFLHWTTALALITGGALGNLYDRIHAGAATDFLDFYAGTYHWYTFNLADTAICIGAGLLILSMFTNRKTA